MDPEYDPAAGFARAAQTMAETQQILAQTTQRIEATQHLALDNQRYALRTLRAVAWMQVSALAMLFVALCGLSWLIWQGAAVQAASAVHTQALQELLRRHPTP
jgi:hypothetical protein